MEKELFDWKEWDGDIECQQFYNVVLKKPIGTKFDAVAIDYIKGIMEFYVGNKVVAKYKLNYVVGEKL